MSVLLQADQKTNIGHKRLHGTWQVGDAHPRATITAKNAEVIKQKLADSPRLKNGWLGRGIAAGIASETGASIHVVREINKGRSWV